jgi:hypothetical protein
VTGVDFAPLLRFIVDFHLLATFAPPPTSQVFETPPAIATLNPKPDKTWVLGVGVRVRLRRPIETEQERT